MSFWQSSVGRLVVGAWEATRGHRGKLSLFLGMFILANVVNMLSVWAIGYILGFVGTGGVTDETLQNIFYGILVYTGLKFLYTSLHHSARYIQNAVAYHVRMGFMSKMFNSFLAFPLRWHLHRHSGENLAKLQRSVSAVDQIISNYIWQIIEGLVKVVVAGSVLFSLDMLVAANVIVMCILTIVLMLFFNRRLVNLYRENNAFYDRINRTVVDFFFNILTIKTLRLEDSGRKYFSTHKDSGLAVSKKISGFMELKWGSVSVGYSIVIASSLWIYLSNKKGIGTAVDVAQAYVLINYLDSIFQAVGSFTGYYGAILESATAYEDGDKVLRELKDLPQVVTKRRISSDWKELEIKDLTFSYGSGNGAGISGLNIKIRKGEKIALVGPSGGGKSTLLKIMGGMIVPEQCSVSFDKGNYTVEDLSAVSLLIPQEPEIFTETIQYNLAVGQTVEQSEIEKFVKICKVDELIAKLPGSWSNFLAEKGLNLSGGERQRIALARGLIRSRDRDIILLDEPTSSVDPFTEKMIFHNILQHFENMTVLTACHRLALVPLFDSIIYVKDGVVQERGSFDELIEKGGMFAKSWSDYQTKIAKAN